MDEILVRDIRDRLERVQEQIASSAINSGRTPEAIRMVVVTKTQPVDIIRAAIAAGAENIGENYAEEAVAKMHELGDSDVEWHMIGHVQSRKAKLVVKNFDLMHSLDSLKLARRLNNFALEAGCTLRVLLEFNVGGESTKYGWQAGDESCWPDLLSDVEQILELGNLSTRGLMTMPPYAEQGEQSRLYFVRLRRLQDFFRSRFPQFEWDELSMGTSADYVVAVSEGATLVRVGTAVLGTRS